MLSPGEKSRVEGMLIHFFGVLIHKFPNHDTAIRIYADQLSAYSIDEIRDALRWMTANRSTVPPVSQLITHIKAQRRQASRSPDMMERLYPDIPDYERHAIATWKRDCPYLPHLEKCQKAFAAGNGSQNE